MAIDFSIGGISVHAGLTSVGVSIDDLAGLGIDFDIDIPVLGDDGGLDSLFGPTSADPAPGPTAEETDSFDAGTMDTLTLLGGAEDADDGSVDPLTGA